MLHLIEHVVTVDDETENVVPAVEPGRRAKRNIELRVARIDPAALRIVAVGVGDNSARTVREDVGILVGNVGELGALVSVTVARTALEHKSVDNAVERFSFVVVVENERHELRGVVRRFPFGVEELNHDFAKGRNGAVRRRLQNGKRDLLAVNKGRGKTLDRTGIDKAVRLAFERVMIRIRGRNGNLVGKRGKRRRVEHLTGFQRFKEPAAAPFLLRGAAAVLAYFSDKTATG